MSAPNVRQLADVQPNERFDAFVQFVERRQRTTRRGDPYWAVTLRDSTASIASNVWLNSPVFSAVESLSPGEVVKIRAVAVENEQYGRQLEIRMIRPIKPEDEEDGFDPALVVPSSRFDRTELLDGLKEQAEAVENPLLRQLVLDVLEEYEEPLAAYPAAERLHHPVLGGLLEHTWSVTKTCALLAKKYADYYDRINSDLVVAGAILHDIGKVRELQAREGVAEYSVEGQLLGHMLLGRDIVREHAAKLDGFPPALLLALEHIIIAHQGKPEWGSPIIPKSPECLIIHYADDLDAKLNMMMQAIEEDTGDEALTSYSGKIKRRVFKGAAALEADAPNEAPGVQTPDAE